MAAATDYLRILGELGIDTDQLWPKSGHGSRILKNRNGERFPGLYFNRQNEAGYFTISPGVASVEIDWNLWQEVPPAIAVPYFDRDKNNIVPKPGQERQALRSLLGQSSGGGLMNTLKAWFGNLTGRKNT
jgi:hypothetical protein